MEFRYRAVDDDRPPTLTDAAPTQSTNANFSFLTAGPMLGANVDHVQEAIRREIEKEKIRQEIIDAETARRRELIAEVVQEMAIERDIAMRKAVTEMGMTLEEKLTMLLNQRKLPIQNQNTHPMMYTTSPMMQLSPLQQMAEAIGAAKATPSMESNKDKLIVLDRPDSIGAKRKAEDSQSGLERAKRKAEAPSAVGVGLDEKSKEEWSCDPCKVSFITESGLNDHLQGKSHKGKESALKAKPISVEAEKMKRFKFWCEICKIGTTSQTMMRNHELGKKHMAAVQKQNEPSESASTSCNIAPQKVDEMAEEETGKKTEGKKKKKVTFWCETCNIRTFSEKVMETHRLGKKHKALLEKEA